jgi:hypothetical protein
MSKQQGYLPIIDLEKNIILGAYTLPSQKIFTGVETLHNVQYPTLGSALNQVKVTKVTPPVMSTNKSRMVNDWFMAAWFTHDEIYKKAYRGYPNFTELSALSPTISWSCTSANPNRHSVSLGALVYGLAENFLTAAAVEP